MWSSGEGQPKLSLKHDGVEQWNIMSMQFISTELSIRYVEIKMGNLRIRDVRYTVSQILLYLRFFTFIIILILSFNILTYNLNVSYYLPAAYILACIIK